MTVENLQKARAASFRMQLHDIRPKTPFPTGRVDLVLLARTRQKEPLSNLANLFFLENCAQCPFRKDSFSDEKGDEIKCTGVIYNNVVCSVPQAGVVSMVELPEPAWRELCEKLPCKPTPFLSWEDSKDGKRLRKVGR